MNSSSELHVRNGGDGPSNTHERSSNYFQEWMQTQQEDLSELLQCLNTPSDQSFNGNSSISELVQKCVDHFEDHISNRRELAEENASSFFAPTWCTSLENSLMWIGGCRPSAFIRLIYALSGSQDETGIGPELLEQMRTRNLRVSDLALEQLILLNELLFKGTIEEEVMLTREMAAVQMEVADQPIAVIASQMEQVGEVNEEAERALGNLEMMMKEVMKKADELRLKTLKELIEILTPRQAAEFIAAGKKLHLCMHEWGRLREQRDGGSH